MFNMIRKLATTITDYTVGTAIVLVHLALTGPREETARSIRLLRDTPARS